MRPDANRIRGLRHEASSATAGRRRRPSGATFAPPAAAARCRRPAGACCGGEAAALPPAIVHGSHRAVAAPAGSSRGARPRFVCGSDPRSRLAMHRPRGAVSAGRRTLPDQIRAGASAERFAGGGPPERRLLPLTARRGRRGWMRLRPRAASAERARNRMARQPAPRHVAHPRSCAGGARAVTHGDSSASLAARRRSAEAAVSPPRRSAAAVRRAGRRRRRSRRRSRQRTTRPPRATAVRTPAPAGAPGRSAMPPAPRSTSSA